MPLGCGLTLVKYILFFFNFIIFISGGVVLGVGIWLAVDKSSAVTVLKVSDAVADDPNINNLNSPAVLQHAAYILIAAGAVIFFLGFLGCCGAIHESKTMLACYASFLMIFLCLEIAAGIYAAVAKDQFQSDFKSLALNSLKKYGKDGNETHPSGLTLAWNYIFAEFECCGVDGFQDFLKDLKGMPKACCKLQGNKADFKPADPTCPLVPTPLNSNMNKGCYDAVVNWMKDHLTIVVGVGLGLGLTQILAVIFACCLCCTLSNQK